MSEKTDLTQTIMAFNAAANRATGAFGNTKQITNFLSLALGEGGPWTGKFIGKNPDSPQNLMVTGFLKSVGDMLIGGDWRITWGPCVYEFNDADRKLLLGTAETEARQCLDNGMYVVYSPSQDVYVVAIAATNVTSLWDWLVEDANVGFKNMIKAPINLDKDISKQHQNASSTVPQLTAGTARGIQILCRQLSDPEHGDLEHYLFKVAERTAKTKIVFTGHSLAAALAPALAYQLYNGLIRAKWTKKNILVLPTAGASPGNLVFKSLWAARFPATPAGAVNPGNKITHFNRLYWNTKDIVPHAWTNFTDYYQKYDKKREILQTNLGEAQGKTLCYELIAELNLANTAGQLSHLSRLPGTSFDGTWPTRYWDDTNPAGGAWKDYTPTLPYRELKDIGTAAGQAHSGQYMQLIGLKGDLLPPAVAAHT